MTTRPRAFVVVNPVSGAGATGRRWDTIARALGRALGPFEHAFTDAPTHATTLTRKALADGFQLLVAVGGDGTVNEVACGLLEGGRTAATEAVLGIVPHGTGCDLARTLGVETGLEGACARLVAGGVRVVDAGRARFVGAEGQPAERAFVNVASFGCGGAVAQALTGATKRLGRRWSYLLTTMRTLRRYRDQPVQVSIDGGPWADTTITNFAVCNGQYFGGGMWVAPQARIDDGRFDLTIWRGFGLGDLILKRPALYSGAHVHLPGTTTARATTVKATSEDRVWLELDGESVGRLPATLDILPAALRLRV